MKKTILFLIGLVCVSVNSLADTRATALLLHNGEGRSFDADQLQQAINEAASGDTICLSEGTFMAGEKGQLVIDKDVCIIGAGANRTTIGGDVSIAIEGNPTLVRNMLEAVKITKTLQITKDVAGVSLRKCWIGSWFSAEGCLAKDVKIDRCFLNQFGTGISATITSATVCNSVIFILGKRNSISNRFAVGYDINFYNCTIATISQNCIWAATFVNCILAGNYGFANYTGIIKDNTFINTLLNNSSSSSSLDNTYIYFNTLQSTSSGNVKDNCYEAEFNCTFETDLNNYPTLSITSEELKAKGFLGTDGTIVGAYGGSTPYSLEPDGIRIKESVLKVDPATRQLNVTLKVE
jgi:hypothetical protein